MISKTIGVILIVATIAVGIYVDFVWLLVGGITQIVHGAEAHPVSGHDIGWGIGRLVVTGIGVGVAGLLCVLWAALFLGHSVKRSRKPSSGRQPYRGRLGNYRWPLSLTSRVMPTSSSALTHPGPTQNHAPEGE